MTYQPLKGWYVIKPKNLIDLLAVIHTYLIRSLFVCVARWILHIVNIEYMYIYVHMHITVDIWTGIGTYIYIYIYVCVCVCVCVWMYPSGM